MPEPGSWGADSGHLTFRTLQSFTWRWGSQNHQGFEGRTHPCVMTGRDFRCSELELTTFHSITNL